jgi:hypothetical protein
MKFVRIRVVLCSRKKRCYLNGDLFSGSFLLGSWRCDQGRAFLLSEVELMRVGSIVAYLAISWARVVDLNPKAEIGPTTL